MGLGVEQDAMGVRRRRRDSRIRPQAGNRPAPRGSLRRWLGAKVRRRGSRSSGRRRGNSFAALCGMGEAATQRDGASCLGESPGAGVGCSQAGAVLRTSLVEPAVSLSRLTRLPGLLGLFCCDKRRGESVNVLHIPLTLHVTHTGALSILRLTGP